MVKQGSTNMWLWFFIVQKEKIRYNWDFNLFKMLKKIQLGSYIVENAKIRYG